MIFIAKIIVAVSAQQNKEKIEKERQVMIDELNRVK